MGRVRYDFSGERALVTGASRGIGRAVAEAYAAAGAEVVFLADDPAAGAVAAAAGAGCRGVVCDITDAGAAIKELDEPADA